MMKSRHLYSITHRALIRYSICILALILTVSVFIYATVVHITYKNEEKSLQSITDQAALVLDHSLADIQNYMNSLRSSEEFRTFSLKSSPSADSDALIRAMQLQRYIKRLSFSSPLAKDVLLYVKRPNAILTAGGQLHLDPTAYFSKYVRSTDAEDDFCQLLTERKRAGFHPASDAYFASEGFFTNPAAENIFFYTSPIISNGFELGQFLVMFSTDAFTSAFRDAIALDSEVSISICDPSGDLIAVSDGSASISEKNSFSVTAGTSVYPLKVRISVPQSYITQKTLYLVIVLGCVFVFLIISCTLLSYWTLNSANQVFI